MARTFFLGLLCVSFLKIYGQKNVNDFKYVLIPEGYVFLSKNDDYQLNSMTKFLFEKYGFTAFIRGEELPEELQRNGCLAMIADVQKKPGLFLTKLVVELKDCNGTVIFTSSEGQSREKEFKRSYQQALRDAFKDVQKLNYRYNSTGKQKNEVALESTQRIETTIEKPTVNRIQDNTEVAAPPKVAIVKEKVETKMPAGLEGEPNLYTLNGKEFVFSKQEYGYELLEKSGDKKRNLGKIFSSERENTYIIKAGDYSGNGYFDAYGNFVLERINPATNKLIKDIFARQ